ncbi:MAG: 1-acyl-sn-glycerol-3-phosphate acyltransferase [Bacilli bacterium]|nr:1-acyl-sn-glycerol-3-phosphate acyltransferase [Bacilli bacterium]
MDTKFYKVVRPFVSFIIKLLFHPKVIGLENIPKNGRVVLAGNHTKWLDPVTLVGVQKRQIHFLAKEELFHGITKFIVKGMGCVPVNRKIHDKNALSSSEEFLNKDLCIGIFPEGTINRTKDIIMPFKIGAVKMSHDTNSKIVPFIITGKYRAFGKSVRIEFLKPISIGEDLEKENKRLMDIVESKLKENRK